MSPFNPAQGRLVVGLTGGIGSGKSTVASLFAELGAGIIDTDVIAHRLTQAGGAAMTAIRTAFGDDYITDDGAKSQLQQMQTSPYIILVVPLLAESTAFRQMVRRVLVVDCDENTQISRVIARGRMTEAEVRAVIAQQTPRAERLQMADDVIRNESGMENLAGQVAVLHQRYANAG